MFIFNLSYCFLLICLFSFGSHSLLAQDQRVADSLKNIYVDKIVIDTTQLELLKQLSFNELNDSKLKLQYSKELINLATKSNNDVYLFHGFYQSGNSYRSVGKLQKSLDAFFKSAEIASQISYPKGEGTAFMAIGDVYSVLNNFNNSESYYLKAIDILRQEVNDSILLGSALLNAGDGYFNNQQYNKALKCFEESGSIFKNIDYEIGTAYNLGNIGIVYAEQGKDSLAEENISKAILVLEKIKDYYPISVFLTYMSDIYAKKLNWNNAFSYAERSLDLAEKYGLKKQISDANLKLFDLHQQKGNFEESIGYLQNYYSYRDSILNINAVEEIADLRTNYEVSQKQTEVDLLDQQKKNQQLISLATGIGLLLIIVVAIGLYRRNNFINKAKLLVEKEKEKSDVLLLNILPEQTAEELKDKGKVQAKRFESVSVMFTDFKGFTQNSANLSPEELVESVNYYYSKFDDIIDKHGLEKIKTVGDAYMCAGGLPFPTKDHPIQMVEAALEIAEFVNEFKKSDPDAMNRFDIRIGINTGPVVAGVVGKKKFAYDIWGDTVNIASRMESNSEPGKVNISDNTYQLIKDKYQCSYRGEIEAKNKGLLKMYFVEDII